MKRYIVCILAACFLLALTACGNMGEDEWISEEVVVGTSIVGGHTDDTNTNDPETDETKSTEDGRTTADKTEVGQTDKTDKQVTTVSRKTRGKRTTSAKKTQKTTAKTTEDPAVYPKVTASVSELVNSKKMLPHGRAAVVGGEFQMDWVNTGFELCGKLGGTLSIQTTGNREDTILNVVVDNNPPVEVHVPAGDQTITLLEGLFKGQHTIKVINGTSLRLGNMGVKSISYEGELQQVSRTRLQIEALGDSITCGWGLDGINGKGYDYYNSNKKLAAISNSYYSYAAVAARKLNADLSVVAQCAQTIPGVHSFFPNLNKRSGAPAWDFKNNQVDVVVINLGTNDEFQGISAADTLANAKALLKDVRKAYPKAHIVWVFGMIRKSYAAQYKQAITEMNDSKASYLDLSLYKDGDGFEAHPDREANELAGFALAEYIKRNCR